MIIFIECVILSVLFTIPLLIMSKNPLRGIDNYPPAIIRRVQEMGLIDDTRLPRSKKVIARKLIAALVIVIICSLVIYFVNGARTFWESFGITYLIWTAVDWYDAVVIDWIWFCHSPRFVIPGTEDMVKDYHDYRFHAKGSLICGGAQTTGLRARGVDRHHRRSFYEPAGSGQTHAGRFGPVGGTEIAEGNVWTDMKQSAALTGFWDRKLPFTMG